MKAIFNTTQSDLLKYNETVVEVGAELTDSERDIEVGKMYHITFHDGVKNDAFEDELSFINNVELTRDELVILTSVLSGEYINMQREIKMMKYDCNTPELQRILNKKQNRKNEIHLLRDKLGSLIGREFGNDYNFER